MDDAEPEFDWSLTTWEGSRRAQLRHALTLSVRERLEAAQGLADVARRFQQMREQGLFRALSPDSPESQTEPAPAVRQPTPSYAAPTDGSGDAGAQRLASADGCVARAFERRFET